MKRLILIFVFALVGYSCVRVATPKKHYPTVTSPEAEIVVAPSP